MAISAFVGSDANISYDARDGEEEESDECQELVHVGEALQTEMV